MTLPDRIREAIAANHVAIEETPFARAVVSGQIQTEDYIVALRELHQLHLALETTMVNAVEHSNALASLYHPQAMNRSQLIEQDLRALGSAPTMRMSAMILQFSRWFVMWGATKPWSLLGPLYVLEGSRMGSMALVRTLAPALGVERRPGVGLDYHLDGIATRPQDWQRFRGMLASLPLSDDEQADVLQAATQTMSGLVQLYSTFMVREAVLA